MASTHLAVTVPRQASRMNKWMQVRLNRKVRESGLPSVLRKKEENRQAYPEIPLESDLSGTENKNKTPQPPREPGKRHSDLKPITCWIFAPGVSLSYHILLAVSYFSPLSELGG